MRLRRAGKGPHAGGTFWGCSRYPDCDGLRDAAPEHPQSCSSGRRVIALVP